MVQIKLKKLFNNHMPFESKAQARYMYAKHPKIAKEFAEKTPSIKSLPEKIKDQKSALKKASK